MKNVLIIMLLVLCSNSGASDSIDRLLEKKIAERKFDPGTYALDPRSNLFPTQATNDQLKQQIAETRARTEHLKELTKRWKQEDKDQPKGREFLKNGNRDLDCRNFSSRKAAQIYYETDTSDPHNLDADNDGLACEHL